MTLRILISVDNKLLSNNLVMVSGNARNDVKVSNNSELTRRTSRGTVGNNESGTFI